MTSPPFFSIVIPVYNRSAILLNTLFTILKQSFEDFEIIIVDDGSAENLESVLAVFLNQEPRIKLIKQENKERGAARNTGYKNSSGNYVVFFDSDDLMHTNHLKIIHEKIVELGLPNFIATKYNFVNTNGKHFNSSMHGLKQGYYDYTLFLNGNPLACNICLKKENPNLFLFEEDRRYAIKEDWMFMLQNLKEQKLFIIDKVTISMFDHSLRSMRSNNGQIIKKTQLALEWIRLNIKLSPEEIKIVEAHVNYFCGIHSYLDDNRKAGVEYSKMAIKSGGFKIKYFLLLLKILIGRNVISKIK